MRVDCVGVRVRWRMYGVGVCVAAKVRMIPLPILYKLRWKSYLSNTHLCLTVSTHETAGKSVPETAR